jgi:hypothetical protein
MSDSKAQGGWMLWVRPKDGREVRVVLVAIADPIQAKEAAITWIGGGHVEAYEQISAHRIKVLGLEAGQIIESRDI